MTMVKICGLTNYDDAYWAWRCGADLLGFVFVPESRRYVTPDRAAKIIEALTAVACAAQYVGVFAGESLENCQAISRECGLSVVQLHGDESPAYAGALDRPYIIARRVQERIPWDELSQYDAWAYLLDSYAAHTRGGTGQTWAWEWLREGTPQAMRRPRRVLLAGGLTPENVGAAIRTAGPWGVDVSSGVEAQPGRKDAVKVQRFIENVKNVCPDARRGEQSWSSRR